MSVTLSVARSADGYIDDCSPERLILSSPEDWAEVYELRAAADAIVIGGETLRRDNPRLRIKCEEQRTARIAQGRNPELCRVIISGKGYIDPKMRIFEGGGDVIIFSNVARPELSNLAEVILCEDISSHFVVTQLEKRGLCNILVEGGAQIISMFLREGSVDALRLATNPTIVVGDSAAPRFDESLIAGAGLSQQYNLGGVDVSLYTLSRALSPLDYTMLERAVELSRNCTPSPSSYCVGAVVVTLAGERFEGYTHETSPTHHAEQEAVNKALAAGAELRGATIYSSIEPCSTRASEPESCSQIIIRHNFRRAIFALYEPSCFVCCNGALNMRKAGVEVHFVTTQSESVREVNSHLRLLQGGEISKIT